MRRGVLSGETEEFVHRPLIVGVLTVLQVKRAPFVVDQEIGRQSQATTMWVCLGGRCLLTDDPNEAVRDAPDDRQPDSPIRISAAR